MIIIKFIISLLVGFVLRVRHFLFDIGVLKCTSFDIPIISVGNLKVGGTGKTPMTEMLISELKKRYNVALLSRGYGRRSKGFVLANELSTCKEIGDEPLLILRRHPDITVAVCEKRVEGVKQIMKLCPAVEIIILDDAFQHRYIDTTMDIILTECDKPYYKDHLLPLGRLRDLRSQAQRATTFVVTKCPNAIKPIDLRSIYVNTKLKPYQTIFFTKMREGNPFPLFDRGYEDEVKELLKGDSVVLVSAVANPKHLITSAEKRFNLISTYIYKDHYNYKQSDINKIVAYAVENNAYIIVTEKDAVKISALDIPSNEKFRFYVAPITIEFIDYTNSMNKQLFIKNIEERIGKKNEKYCYTHKQFNV